MSREKSLSTLVDLDLQALRVSIPTTRDDGLKALRVFVVNNNPDDPDGTLAARVTKLENDVKELQAIIEGQKVKNLQADLSLIDNQLVSHDARITALERAGNDFSSKYVDVYNYFIGRLQLADNTIYSDYQSPEFHFVFRFMETSRLYLLAIRSSTDTVVEKLQLYSDQYTWPVVPRFAAVQSTTDTVTELNFSGIEELPGLPTRFYAIHVQVFGVKT